MARRQQNSLNLTTCIAIAWGGVTAAALTIRFIKRKRYQIREERIAKQGGLLPQVRNVVQALELRAKQESTSNQLAIKGANGTEYTWKAYYENSRKFGMGLSRLGQKNQLQEAGGGVAIHAFNCPEWFFCSIGALCAGWTVSGIYLTNTYEQAAHILKTSRVKVLVLENRQLFEDTYRNVLDDFPDLTVVLLDGGDSDLQSRTPSWTTFCSFENGKDSQSLKSPSQLDDENVATLVYTSGTTGNPKAVQLTLKNIHTVCAMMHSRIPLNESTKVVSYLPLSHIAAMGIDLFSPIYCGGQVYFADSKALKGSLRDTLLQVRPTLFFGVPRVWEKMATAMREAAAKSYSKPIPGTVLKSIGTAAKVIGTAWWNTHTNELVRCLLLPLPFGLFKLLAYRKIRKGCGLDRCQLLYTGAAPVPEDVYLYLKSLDMPLLEVFGMSESCGAIAVSGPLDGDRPIGSCGRGLPAGSLEIAPDGEIMWKGNNNMVGYYGLPEETARAINNSSGMLHTGDLGTIDSKGFLSITGRKKDIIITAGGENVAPIPIEDEFKSLLSSAGHVLLVGDRRKFLTILITPMEGQKGSAAIVINDVEEAIKTYNSTLAKSRAQRVQRACILEQALSVETGDLTPTLKVKRSFVFEKYAKEIDAMYSDGASGLVAYSKAT